MRRIVLFLALIVATPLLAQDDEQTRAFRQLVKSSVVHQIPGMDRVAVRRDLRYSKADKPWLLADAYTPPDAADETRHPVVVFIHGGLGPDIPVRPKDWGPYISWGRLVAASGMIGVTFNHRLGYPDPQLEIAAGDLRDLVAYVRANAAELHADPDRICLAAYSAGGPLLSLGMRGEIPGVRCLVSFYNFLDMTDLHRQYGTPAIHRAFSPAIQTARQSVPPMFVARAGKDEIPDLNQTIDRFVASALANNVDLTLVNHPAAPHGFDFKTKDARSREILELAVDFMKRHLFIDQRLEAKE